MSKYRPNSKGLKSRMQLASYNRAVKTAGSKGLDGTAPETHDSKRTDEVEDEKQENRSKPKIKKKSIKLKIWDYFVKNIVQVVFSGIILSILGYLLFVYGQQIIQDGDIKNLKNDTSQLKTNSDTNLKNIGDLKIDFATFSTSVNKDIEYLKEQN